MSLLELNKISKCYGEGSTLVQALTDIDLSVDRGPSGRRHGAVRLGQVDPAHHRREPGGADER